MEIQRERERGPAQLPPTQDGLCPLGGKIKAVQVESQQDLLPPLSSRCQLEDAVSHPGEGGAGARPVKTKRL